MTQAVIIDIVVAVVLLLFAAVGAKKGLLKSVAGIVILVLAVLGAALAAKTVTPVVGKLLQPVVEERVENWVVTALEGSGAAAQDAPEETPGLLEELLDGLMSDQTDDDQMENLREVLETLGLDAELVVRISGTVKEKMESSGVSAAVGLVQALAETVIRAVVFLLAFLILLVVLKVVMKAMDLVVTLPIVRTLNALGGAAVSLLEAVLLLFVAAWVARRLGVDFAFAEGTKLCSFFLKNSPLSILSFL